MNTMQLRAAPETVEIDATRTAVLVIDMQNAFGSPGGMFDKVGVPISSIQAAVGPTKSVVDAARLSGLKVIYLKMGFQPNLSDIDTRGGAREHFSFTWASPTAC